MGTQGVLAGLVWAWLVCPRCLMLTPAHRFLTSLSPATKAHTVLRKEAPTVANFERVCQAAKLVMACLRGAKLQVHPEGVQRAH